MFDEEIEIQKKNKLKWFPGHMKKALDDIEDNKIKLADVILYVLDSRAPFSCLNPNVNKIVHNKPIIYVFNKFDLADEKRVIEIQKQFSSENKISIIVNATSSGFKQVVKNALKQVLKDKIERNKAKNLRATYKVLVLGVPNTGKSTLINMLSGAKKAKTGNIAGVTKVNNWIKIDEVETSKSLGTYRVLAGWKPNDPKADGRVQSAIIVIENKSDGGDREEYTITRQNWGLPVTYLNGVWWCKYNAMGDSRKFEDQILSANDPAAKAGKTLYEYLGVCSAEEYLNLWKWQYMGDKTQGLEVVDDNGVAKLDGYFNNTVHINKLDPKSIAPKGYELPSMEDYNNVLELIEGDYIWLMWDGAHKTGWNGGTTLQRRQKRRNDVSVGSVALPDLIYIGMYNASVSEYEPLVWYGSSSQWDNSGIKHGHYNNMLFAVSNPETGQGWYFNGSMQGLYATKNGAGANNTRIVRFKKSDVEYIYR